MKNKLSANFSWAEFACHDGTEVPAPLEKNVIELVENLEIIRKFCGSPLKINSGYRTVSHNEAIRGRRNSQHLQAKAADLCPLFCTPSFLYKIILKLMKDGRIMQGGLHLYDTFVHYDIRGKITLF